MLARGVDRRDSIDAGGSSVLRSGPAERAGVWRGDVVDVTDASAVASGWE
jgi:hypothetical protein